MRSLGTLRLVAALAIAAPSPRMLAQQHPVSVTDSVLRIAEWNTGLERVGFNQRRMSGRGYFLDPEQLQAMNAEYLTDILRKIPNVRVYFIHKGYEVTMLHGGNRFNGSGTCVLTFLDGIQFVPGVKHTPPIIRSFFDGKEILVSPGNINTFVPGNEIVAVEVFTALNTPKEYESRRHDCGTILFWTGDGIEM